MKNKKQEIIGVFGHYGNKNLGDESITAAVIQNIKKLRPTSIIYGLSINPSDTAERHQVPAYPIRRLKKKNKKINNQLIKNEQPNQNKIKKRGDLASAVKTKIKTSFSDYKRIIYLLKLPLIIYKAFTNFTKEIIFLQKSFKLLMRIDKLFISGSNQFLDNFGGVFGFPYTLLKWTLMAKLARVKVYYLSLGAGPIKSSISMVIIRICIFLCDYISLRDWGSKNLVGLKECKEAKVMPDLAFSYDVDYKNEKRHKISSNDQINTIGINPMPVHDARYWPIADAVKYMAYTEKLARLYIELKTLGFNPFFYNTQISDLFVIDDIVSIVQRFSKDPDIADNILIKKNEQLKDLLKTISETDLLIPTRFHGIILSYLLEVPVVGICYGDKSKELIADMYQGEYAFDIDSFKVNKVIEKVKQLRINYKKETQKIMVNIKQYREQLNNQYNLILND